MHVVANFSASKVNIVSCGALQGQNHTISGARRGAKTLDFVLLRFHSSSKSKIDNDSKIDKAQMTKSDLSRI